MDCGQLIAVQTETNEVGNDEFVMLVVAEPSPTKAVRIAAEALGVSEGAVGTFGEVKAKILKRYGLKQGEFAKLKGCGYWKYSEERDADERLQDNCRSFRRLGARLDVDEA